MKSLRYHFLKLAKPFPPELVKSSWLDLNELRRNEVKSYFLFFFALFFAILVKFCLKFLQIVDNYLLLKTFCNFSRNFLKAFQKKFRLIHYFISRINVKMLITEATSKTLWTPRNRAHNDYFKLFFNLSFNLLTVCPLCFNFSSLCLASFSSL